MTYRNRRRLAACLLALVMLLPMALTASAAVLPNSKGILPEKDNGENAITIHKFIVKDEETYNGLRPGDGKTPVDNDAAWSEDWDDASAATKTWQELQTQELIVPHGGVDYLIVRYDESRNMVAAPWPSTVTSGTAVPEINGNTNPENKSMNVTVDGVTKQVSGYVGTTTANGELIIDKLEFGYYEIYEMGTNGFAPKDYPIKVNVPTQLYDQTVSDGNTIKEWIYDIHVYPKNISRGDFEKKIKDVVPPDTPDTGTNAGRGNQYVWEIAVELPKAALEAALDSSNPFWIEVTDPLDQRLILDSILVEYAPNKDGTKTPIDKTDYYVDQPNAGNFNTVTILFSNDTTIHSGKTAPGIQTLYDKMKPNPNDKPYLYITLTTYAKTTDKDNADTEIGNPGNHDGDPGDRDATVKWPDMPGIKIPPGEPGTKTGTGTIKIVKQDGNSSDPLTGAEFMLFRSEAAAKSYDPSTESAATNPHNREWLAKNAVRNFNVSDDGIRPAQELYIFGPTVAPDGELFITDINAWHETTDTGGNVTTTNYTYWLVETKAPIASDGRSYNLLTEPKRVDFSKGNKVESVAIDNFQGFTLPRTGGTGTLLFTVTGLGLITIAGVAFILYRRRRREKDDAA